MCMTREEGTLRGRNNPTTIGALNQDGRPGSRENEIQDGRRNFKPVSGPHRNLQPADQSSPWQPRSPPGSSSGAEGPGIRTAQDLLLDCLEDITGREFKRFKDKLSDFSYGDKRPIPRGKLEHADPVDTKNHLIYYYGEKGALEVTIRVFTAIGLMGPARRLQEEKKQMYYRRMYMNWVKEKYQLMVETNSCPGDIVHLKSRYTTLLQINKHRNEEEREHEITATGRRHVQIMANRSTQKYSPTTVQTLFDPDERGISPRTVVLAGPAGIGKTLTSQKIMLDWSSGDLYKDRFNYVFYISCREINNITGKMSIARFLSEKCQPTCPPNQIQCILRDPSKLLFIIDGLDELKWSHNEESEVCKDPSQETRKEIILNSLFRKQVLEEASLIITTRPFTLEKLIHNIEKPRYVEILGFTEENREQFFYHFFEMKEQAEMALNVVKDNETLFTMCSVPVICWIVCIVMKQQMGRNLKKINSKTSTSLYMLYLKGLLNFHGPGPNRSVKASLMKLCALAKEGIWDRKILFEEEDLSKHGLTVSDIKSLFLNENIFVKDIETYTSYSFIHLSVQEFLAALYYVLSEGTKFWHVLENFRNQRDVQTLLEKCDSGHQHLSLTVRFLFGLCSEQQINATKNVFGCEVRQKTKSALKQWLKGNKFISDEERLNCLFETQDEEFVRRMMSHFLHLRIIGSSVSPTALSYCLMNSTSHHTIDLFGYRMDRKLQDIVFPALNRCTKIELQYCGLTSDICEDLRSVIITNRSLTRLDLSNNKLQDSGVKHLCDGLRHPDCNLQQLRLDWCGLTSVICEDLRSVIITNRSLTRLDLSRNDLQDSGVKRLCDGLRHPDCNLQELGLELCDLTSDISDDLRSVIITNRSLTRLDLSRNNNLQESGVKLLCDGLRHQDSTLQQLRSC
ncbi:NACHT, LRR and PYD domains-containing protein 12-like, partial [Rhinophrynus dorsalis]